MAELTPALTGAEEVAWDLSELYEGPHDPRIDADIQTLHGLADNLTDAYKGKIATLTPAELAALVVEREKLDDLSHRIGMFAHMLWSTNTGDPARGALMAKVTEQSSRLGQKLVWIGLEIADLPEEKAQTFISAPELESVRHWLETTRQFKPYLLTEPEEKILREKDITGRSAWDRFFDEVNSAHRYSFNGEELPLQVLLNKLYDGDRTIRQQAAASVSEGLRRIGRYTTYIFNMILADKASDDRLRKYPTWLSARNLGNEVGDDSVQALIEATTSRYDIVARYYRLKKTLLGLDELFDYDRYAPLPAADTHFTWDEGREIVLNAFGSFHPRIRETAERFFDGHWIDAPVRPDKYSGAYAMPGPPSLHPYIFLNFEGRSRDVETLAHELGHGIHMYLSQQQSILVSGTPLTTAETASVFGEALVFEDIMARTHSPAARLGLLTARIEGSFATVFRQIAMNRFEDAIHTARRTEGELSSERFGALWLETQRAMFQGSVTLSDDYGIWWSYIPHFIGSPGYVYAYAFGELLVLALYATYKQAPDGFAERYITMLSAGGSDWPHAIVRPLGIDLTDPGFWHTGLDILDDLVSQAEELAHQVAQSG